jgi:hypothetical protein
MGDGPLAHHNEGVWPAKWQTWANRAGFGWVLPGCLPAAATRVVFTAEDAEDAENLMVRTRKPAVFGLRNSRRVPVSGILASSRQDPAVAADPSQDGYSWARAPESGHFWGGWWMPASWLDFYRPPIQTHGSAVQVAVRRGVDLQRPRVHRPNYHK